ncbi:MAG: hypothetical protein Q8Q35_00860 [Nanoarchaeota archaeon]|nr:hypothetical protein [Nanoarchaeota archaeon]
MLWIVPIIVFLGFVVGYFIKRYVPEEDKHRKKYFVYLEKGLLLSILGILYFYYRQSIPEHLLIDLGVLLLGVVVGYLFKESYLYLGMIMTTIEIYTSMLIFMYGLVKGNKRIIEKAVYFFIPFLLLLIPSIESYILVFGSGGVLVLLFQKSY